MGLGHSRNKAAVQLQEQHMSRMGSKLLRSSLKINCELFLQFAFYIKKLSQRPQEAELSLERIFRVML